MVFIISGKQGEGKTSRLIEVVELLRKAGKKPVGFVADGSWKDGLRDSFTIRNIQSGASTPMCRSTRVEGWQKEGRFYFNPQAIDSGNKWLSQIETHKADFTVVDEMGIFELDGKIWHPLFQRLLDDAHCPLIITVRESIVEKLIDKYKLSAVEIFKLESPADLIAESLLNFSTV